MPADLPPQPPAALLSAWQADAGLAWPEGLHGALAWRPAGGQQAWVASLGSTGFLHGLGLSWRLLRPWGQGEAFLEVGGLAQAMAPLSPSTPDTRLASAWVGTGARWRWGPVAAELSLGSPPLPLWSSGPWPWSSSVGANWPRVALRLGWGGR